jgi:hypothetical protein
MRRKKKCDKQPQILNKKFSAGKCFVERPISSGTLAGVLILSPFRAAHNGV